MTPIQNPVQQGQIHNYGEQKSKQNVTLTTRVETSSRPRENNMVQVDSRQAGSQGENTLHHQIHYQKMLSRDQMNGKKLSYSNKHEMYYIKRRQ